MLLHVLFASFLDAAVGLQSPGTLTSRFRAQDQDDHPTKTFSASRECRNAIDHQRARFSSHWERQATFEGMGFNGHEIYSEVLVHEGLSLTYISNQKVASRSALNAFSAFDGQSQMYRLQYSGAQPHEYKEKLGRIDMPHIDDTHQWNLTLSQEQVRNKFLFTIVREPLAAAWSAYTEVSHRTGRKYDNGDLQMTTPCNGGDDRYLEYLDLLKTGKIRHRQAFHSFPQVAKVDVLQGLNRSAFDFIVRLEHFDEDMKALFASLKSPPGEKVIQDFIYRFNEEEIEHPHDSKCDRAIAKTSSEHGFNEQTCKAACALYDIDFVCFNYPRPNCCS